MYLASIITLAILIAILAVGVALYRRGHRKAWHPQVVLSEQILASNDDTWKAAQKFPRDPKGIYSEREPAIISDAYQERYDAKKRLEEAELLARYNRVRTYTTVPGVFRGYKDLRVDLLDPEFRGAATSERAAAGRNYADWLLNSTEGGHIHHFYELVEMITPPPRGSVSVYRNMTHEHYLYPDGWNELVATLYKRPSVSTFDVPSGTSLAELGQEALDTSSLGLAKLVLAHYDESTDANNWRRAIGVRLVARLVKLIDQIEVEQGLIFAR